MGAWGTALFSDDTACDVRERYKLLLRESQNSALATERLLQEFAETCEDPDDGPVFWLALALTQHKLGRLEPRVRSEALALLERGAGLERWREAGPRELKKRQAVHDKLRAELLSPLPPPRNIRPIFRDSTQWTVGELVAYRLRSERYIVLRVVSAEEHAHGRAPVVELLDWEGAAPPPPAALAEAAIRRANLSPWSLFQLLARSASLGARDPALAMKGLLADLGLLAPEDACVSMASLLDPAQSTPAGFDWAKHHQRVEKALDRVRAASAAVEARLKDLARQRVPALLAPITQFSLRREPGLESLPTRRLKRLRSVSPAAAPGEWLALRWTEFDELLQELFGLT